MVTIAFVTCMVSAGFVFYSYGVFFKAIQAEFGGSRFAVSIGLTAMNFAVAVTSPMAGSLLDGVGAKRVMTIGAMLLGTGFALASRVTALWQFHLVFGTLLGASVCMLGPLASSALITNWFVQRRGAALAYATMGVSAAGILAPIYVTTVISSYGWRAAFLICSAVVFTVLLPLVYFGVVSRPEDLGLRADGQGADETATPAVSQEASDFRLWSVVRSQRFIAIAIVIGLNACCMQGVTTHLVPYLTDSGWTAAEAAGSLSLLALSGLMARPVFGYLVGRLSLRSLVLVAVALQMLGLLTVMTTESARLVLTGLCVFALGMGCLMPLQGALIAATFGRRVFGRVMGVMSPVMFPLINIGAPLAGWFHDTDGDYRTVFKVFLALYGLSVAAAVAWLKLPEPSAVNGVRSQAVTS